MSGSLQGLSGPATFRRLLQVNGSGLGLDNTPRAVLDGEGDASPLLLSTSSVQVSSAPVAPNDVVRLFDLSGLGGGSDMSLTDAELRATPVPVSGTVTITDGAGPVTVDGTVAVSGSVAVTGPVTDAQLRASAVPVSATDLATLAAATALEDAASPGGERGMVMLALRRDADSSTAADGDYTQLKMDEAGRLKVASQPGLATLSTGSITASAQTVAVNVQRQSNIMVHVVATSLVGHNSTFEGSIDSTNGTDGAWFALQALRSNANTIDLTTGVLAATPAYGWELSVNGLAWFRVRATAHTSGTALWKVQPAPFATEPLPGAQVSATQPVSGSVTATLAAATVRAAFYAAAGIWFDDSSTVLAGAATFTGTSRDATVTATATAMANAATYAMEVRAAAESDQTGTLWLEVSRDNAAWRRIRSVATVAITGGGFAAEIIYRPAWRYWRIGYTNGATLQTRFTLGTIALAA